MRLFVAIEIEARVIRAAADLIEELRARAARLAPRARIGWVLADRMHLTVRFIGHVDDAQAARIRAVLEAPIPVPPFAVRIAGVGTFPPNGTPRVIWAGIPDAGDSLAAIEREITTRLEGAGVPPEDRPYNPHLTLARVREAAGLRSAPLVGGLDERELGTSRVSACTLFESRLSPKGPTYVSLQRTPLR